MKTVEKVWYFLFMLLVCCFGIGIGVKFFASNLLLFSLVCGIVVGTFWNAVWTRTLGKLFEKEKTK